MRSQLLHGKVRHTRVRPKRYQLEHDVFYFALDLDELDRLRSFGWLVGRNRRALFELRDADHLKPPASDLATDFRRHLARSGIDLTGGRVTLVTNLRTLGYVFNPASFWLCRDREDRLVAVVVEVHNTYGERHLYTLRAERGGATFGAQMEKDFYVSPFIGPDGRYRVTLRDTPRGLAIGINEREAGEPLLATSLNLARLPLTRRALLRLLLRNPLVTYKTIAFIHLHALRLWLRGIPFRRHGTAPVAVHGARR
jgi:uncharacterized protein